MLNYAQDDVYAFDSLYSTLDSSSYPIVPPTAPTATAFQAPFHFQPESYTDGYDYVQRHAHSTRAHVYHPYARPAQALNQWDQPTAFAFDPIDYNSYSNFTSTIHPAQLCADPHSFGSHHLYDHSPTEFVAQPIPEPASPVSPYQSSSDRASSPSTTGPATDSSTASVSPTLLVAPQPTRLTWSLPSPVESVDSEEESKRQLQRSKSKRATRSAPEPAWVEAVLAEDAKRTKATNRPIAFACVFCRHRKIQCIRPKTDVAPGEKPSPCNQCEKRNRCCEYPPAALNPRVGRRSKTSKGLVDD